MADPVIIRTDPTIPVTKQFAFPLTKEVKDTIDRALSLVYSKVLTCSLPVLLRAAYIQGMIDTLGMTEKQSGN